MDDSADAGMTPLREALADYKRRLDQIGRTVAVSGTVSWAEGLLAVHSDYGPVGQDKDANQDYALAWTPRRDEPHAVRWAVALADGVTSSFGARWGAELACWAALARLIEQADALAGRDLAMSSIHEAGAAIRRLAESITTAGDRLRPQDEFLSTWEFILQEGLLLQTTLTLAWSQGGTLNLSMVGDGGAALRERDGEAVRDTALVPGVPQTSRVHALGPKNDHVSELDVWHEIPLSAPALLALYTDGIRAGVGDDVASLLDGLRQAGTDEASNPAQRMVREFLDTGREELLDNLTLAVVRWQE